MKTKQLKNYVCALCVYLAHGSEAGCDQCCPSVLEYSLKSEQLAQGRKRLATKQPNTLLRAFDIIGKQV